AGHVAPPKSDPEEIAIETMNTILGGSFTSRVNMDLREQKHWSYGARTIIASARGQSPFIVYAPVQTDKTKESMIELEKDLRGVLGDRPITEGELQLAQQDETLKLPGSWEADGAVVKSIGEIVRFGLPENYFTVYPERVRNLTLANVTQAAKRVVLWAQRVWLV